MTSRYHQLLARLSDFALKRADGWVVGHGYDDTQLREKRHPTAMIWTEQSTGSSRWCMCQAISRGQHCRIGGIGHR